VSSAPRSHHPFQQKSFIVTSTTPQTATAGPRRLPATDQPSLPAPKSLPNAATRATSARHQRPAGPYSLQPSRRHRIRPQPGLRTYRPLPPAPAPSLSPVHGQSPALRGQRSCTAVQYSNAADQQRPTTPTTGQRPAKITTIDPPARSSGRRGRGFKSRHPDKNRKSEALCHDLLISFAARVRSTQGAVSVFQPVRFLGSPPEPGVPVVPAPGSPQVP
jgi:hypothetical protein